MNRTELIEKVRDYASKFHDHDWKKLYKCSAEYLDTPHMIILKSYWTITAVYDKKDLTVYSFNSYSATSNQHLRKFCKKVGAEYLRKLYKDSTKCLEEDLVEYKYSCHPNSSAWKTIISQDFCNVILDHFPDEYFE